MDNEILIEVKNLKKYFSTILYNMLQKNTRNKFPRILWIKTLINMSKYDIFSKDLKERSGKNGKIKSIFYRL